MSGHKKGERCVEVLREVDSCDNIVEECCQQEQQ